MSEIKIAHHLQHERAAADRTLFGLWMYIMTDLLMFAVLFAVYAVLQNSTAGGPHGHDIFSLNFVMIETLLLLTSSLTCGLASLSAKNKDKKQLFIWLVATFLLGATFLSLEVWEFSKLVNEGHTVSTSAFLSSYFALVGNHGLHILAGLIWIIVSLIFISKRGLTHHMQRKINSFSMFWHFLDIVWIFIFTLVYLRAFI